MFFISVDSKQLKYCASRLVSTLTGRCVSVDSKWLRGNRKKKGRMGKDGWKGIKTELVKRLEGPEDPSGMQTAHLKVRTLGERRKERGYARERDEWARV
jgi:hypothetical protein